MEQVSLYLLAAAVIAMAVSLFLFYTAFKQRNRNERAGATFRTLTAHSTDPVFIINAGGKILYVNEAFASWIGYKRRDLARKSIYLYTSYLQDASIEDAMRKGKAWAGTIAQKMKDGSLVPAYLLLKPVRDNHGKVREFIGIYLDMRHHTISPDDTRYESAIRQLPDGVVVLQDERIVFANPAAIHMLGYDAEEELTRVHFASFVAPQSRSFAEELYAKGLEGEMPESNYDMKFQTKTNDTVDLEVNTSTVTWNNEPAVLLSIRDVAERKRTEREQAQWLWGQELLNTVERQLVSTVDLNKVLDMIVYHARLLVRADIAAVLTIDPEKETYRWLAVKGNTGDYPASFIPLTNASKEFYHESEPRIIQNIGNRTLYAEEDFPLLSDEDIKTVVQYPLMRGSIVFGHLTLGYRKEYELSERLLKLIQSFTERATVAIMNAELYDQLRQQTKNLQQLFETRMQAQEDERRRIAAELHDSLGQLLTSIKLHIEVLQDSDIFIGTAEKDQMIEIRSLLDNAITEARNISYDLRPSILDDFGLLPALEVLCDKFSMRSGLTVSFQAHNLEARLKNQLETALYRITQEALHNVQKHAEATEVNVHIIRTPKTINLVIEDNGKGFDPEKADEVRYVGADGKIAVGMGIVSMRERAAHFKGTFTVDSTPGQGTDIIVEIPLSGVIEHAETDPDNPGG